MSAPNDKLIMSSFQSFFSQGFNSILDSGHQQLISGANVLFDMLPIGQCHWGNNNWALFPVKMLRIKTNIYGCQIACTATARWQYHKKPMDCCIIGYQPEIQISQKSHSLIIYFEVIKSFWNFSWRMPVSLAWYCRALWKISKWFDNRNGCYG